jgi:cytochrome c553
MRIVLFFLLTFRLLAQDGGQLYGLYCSACHGADGAGATGGQFPPLAGSEWVQGNAERSIQIVLHGLHEPIEVKGKTFNLEMPPQGAALTDDQIAAILTYVRASWNNKGSAVIAEQVKKARVASQKRDKMWTAKELLGLYPLENRKPPITNLISHHYKGNFSTFPDFHQLKPDAVEEEPSGLIDIGDHAKTDQFAMMWEGEITTKAGPHEFHLDSDDLSCLWVDGAKMLEIGKIGPMGRSVKKVIRLSAGIHKIRVAYIEATGLEGISLGVKEPGSRVVRWLSKEQGNASGKSWPEIMLAPADGRPVIYRNFIQGTTARGIGVGFPGNINIAYSADNLAPEMIWSGKFIDAGHHWTDRGIGYEPPAEEEVFRASKQKAYALTSEAAQAWPANSSASTRFRGYQLNDKGEPTFLVEVSGARVFDAYASVSGASPALLRSIRVDGRLSSPATLLIFQGAASEMKADRFTAQGCTVEVTGGAFRYGNGAVMLDLTQPQVQIRYAKAS